MFSCISALDLSHYFFTAADYEDALIDIEELLKKFDDSKSVIDFPTAAKKEILERAYSKVLSTISSCRKPKPEKQLIFLLGDILRRYGHLCFEESYLASKQCLLAALNMNFYAMEIIDDCIDMQDFVSLEDLKMQGKAKPHLFAFMEELIVTTDVNSCLTKAYTSTFVQRYSERRLLNLAQTVRWLGHCYQNIDKYNALTETNKRRFKQLFTLSESLLLILDTPQSYRELGDLYFKAWPFMHLWNHPEDIQGACEIYNKALACDPSPDMNLRVASMRFVTLFNAGHVEDALPYIVSAVQGVETIKKVDVCGFLHANIHYNYAGYFMNLSSVDFELAERHLQIALNFGADKRSKGEDHVDFALYDMRSAELNIALEKYKIADKAIKSAIATLKKFPESQKSFIEKAEALQALVEKFQDKGKKPKT